MNLYSDNKDRILSAAEFRQQLQRQGQLQWYKALPDSLYFALLDSLEYAQLDEQGKRLRERADLEHTAYEDSVSIYRRFAEQAKLRLLDQQKRPRIAVITASSRDPFEVADFYLSVFTQAGADVIWLPLDQTFRQARELERLGFAGCAALGSLRATNLSFYREDIYPRRTAKQLALCQSPEQLLRQLGDVQGVFFNGGDQSLTLSALKYSDGSDTEWMALIRQQVAAGKLIVGGTSAGTAVQAGGEFAGRPVPMITNGHPTNALKRGALATVPPSQRCQADTQCSQGVLADDLTFNANGGTGLFTLGLMDTHFSERDREARLAVFAAAADQPFGFGVDETTALMARLPEADGIWHFEVVGRQGVFIVDRRQGFWLKKQTGGIQISIGGLAHYLTDGNTFSFNQYNMQWDFEGVGPRLREPGSLAALDHGQWRDITRKHCGRDKPVQWNQFGYQFVFEPSAKSGFFYTAQRDHCSYINLPFTINYLENQD